MDRSGKDAQGDGIVAPEPRSGPQPEGNSQCGRCALFHSDGWGKPGAKEGDTDGARRVELIRNGSVEIFGGPLWP